MYRMRERNQPSEFVIDLVAATPRVPLEPDQGADAGLDCDYSLRKPSSSETCDCSAREPTTMLALDRIVEKQDRNATS